MKNTLLSLFALALLSTALPSSLKAQTVTLPKYGFQIDALDHAPGPESTAVFMTFLPASDGFAPNINVMIQTYPETMADYVKLTKSQFQQAGLEMIKESEPTKDEWTVEYKGNMQGRPLHFYAKAILKSGKVYLATATATPEQWASEGATLSKHVDSLKTP